MYTALTVSHISWLASMSFYMYTFVFSRHLINASYGSLTVQPRDRSHSSNPKKNWSHPPPLAVTQFEYILVSCITLYRQLYDSLAYITDALKLNLVDFCSNIKIPLQINWTGNNTIKFCTHSFTMFTEPLEMLNSNNQVQDYSQFTWLVFREGWLTLICQGVYKNIITFI